MKKLFLLLALLGMVATGCSKDEVGNIPDDAYISLDKEIVTISPDGESVGVKVYSNYAWELTNNCDWITTSITSGDASDTGVTVTLTADLTYDDRDGTIVFSCDKAKKLLVVSQKLKEVIIPDANNTFNIPVEGGVAILNYQTTVDCDVIIPEEAQDWITIAPASRGLVSENITLNVAENTTYSARTAVVKVVGKDNAELVVEYTINQEQNNAILADENNTFTVPSAGGEVVINYQTNIDCEVIIPEEAQSWITIEPATRGLVSESITLNIAENTTYSARTAVIKVVAKDNDELTVEYTINQEQNDAILADENNTFTVPSAGGEVVINYQINIDCEVIIPEEAQDWITIAPASRGLISKSSTLNVAENTTYSARTAVIKVVAKDNAELAVEYTINQEQNNAILANGNTEFTIDGKEQLITIEHKANIDCDVIIPDEAQDWVTIAPSTRGLSTYSTTLNIAENNSGKERSCVVKVTSQGNKELSAEYTIIQKTRHCLYYTSSNGKIVTPYYSSSFDATIVSNTYIDGVGVIEFDAPITMIGYEAFNWCKSLTSVTIPNSVTKIGERAFYLCDSLTSVTIPDSVTMIGDYAFYKCSSLTSVTIPDIVTTIGNYAFESCSSLTNVTIGDSVTTIGDYAFALCSSLTSITIGDSVTTIGDHAFSSCDSLTSVTIGDSVTSIGDYAFNQCDSLTSVTIGNSVTTIGNYVFRYCSSLTSVTIPDSVTTIGKSAFYDCDSLTSVTIGDGVTEIGSTAFVYCNSLQEFRGKFASEDNRCLIIDGTLNSFARAGLTEYTIPNIVTTIGSSAFENCDSLTSINIPESVTSIGDYAFSHCESLTSVTIGDSVTEIGKDAFSSCSSLTSVTIPDSVTTIGIYAFCYCSSLTSVYCKPTTPPAGGSSMFSYNASDRKIYVPMESVEAYKSASYWSSYSYYIEGYNF